MNIEEINSLINLGIIRFRKKGLTPKYLFVSRDVYGAIRLDALKDGVGLLILPETCMSLKVIVVDSQSNFLHVSPSLS